MSLATYNTIVCVVGMPTRTQLVTEVSQKAVYPYVAPSIFFDPPSLISSHFVHTLTEHLKSCLYHIDRSEIYRKSMIVLGRLMIRDILHDKSYIALKKSCLYNKIRFKNTNPYALNYVYEFSYDAHIRDGYVSRINSKVVFIKIHW